MKRPGLLGALAVTTAVGVVAVTVIALQTGRTGSSEDDPRPYRDAAPIPTAGLPVELEALTWTEVRALLAAGHRTVIVPTGGTEQNGPHMILGKHNHVVRHTAEAIARELGDALVAPVIAYVPEGSIEPATGHMQRPGTISIPEATFESVLEATARSLLAHGFENVCFVGDSGDNQRSQQRVADLLGDELRGSGSRVLHVGAYYADNGQQAWLEQQGEAPEVIGRHAAIRDTSELLAVHPEGVRRERARSSQLEEMLGSGVDGDPTRASAERGRTLLKLKVDAAVRQIRAELAKK